MNIPPGSRTRPFVASALALLSVAAFAVQAADTVSLAGRWRYELDRNDAGVQEAWFNRTLPGLLRLPGSLPGQGLGDEVTVHTTWTGGIVDKSWFSAPEYAPYRLPGKVKVPFWLQPETHYMGVAWYQRDITLAKEWAGQRVVLTLERAHWETRVWLDGRFVGANDSLSTPHAYELGVGLAPGPHRLTLRVDNRMVVDVGENSHSVSDHTQGNWNGIVGRIELRATPLVWIEDLQVYPHHLNARPVSVTVKGRVGNATGEPRTTRVALRPRYAARMKGPDVPLQVVDVPLDARGGTFVTEVSLGSDPPLLWDEFAPQLYTMAAFADFKSDPSARRQQPDKEVTFGLRAFAAEGTQFTINGRKTFLRGTLECAIFPKTGHTPTDLASWRKVIRAAQAHGLNNLRFHSHCPPEAAFQAADELGMYLHVECGTWPNQPATLGDGKPVDDWLYREADRILQTYGNHPSFVILLHGNEPGGDRHAAYLTKWVAHYKSADARRLYSSGAGWPQLPENQLHVTPDPRIQAWGQGLKSRINAQPPETATDYRKYIQARSVPVVSHEIGQWCVYPNFDEMKKYTGYLKPRNFEIFRDSLDAQGMLDQARKFLFASGKLQTLCYKEDIESALRTPGMAGFQLLDLHDFPGQGTALVGVLDPFWEGKGYVTSLEYSRFCNATVPLLRLPKRVFTTDDDLNAELEVAHFGRAPLSGVAPAFKLVGDDGKVRRSGELERHEIPVGNGTSLGSLHFNLRGVPAPARYRLVVSLRGNEAGLAASSPARKVAAENDWDVWVYPPQMPTAAPPDILVTEELNEPAATALSDGGKVLLLVPPAQVKGDRRGKVALGFSSIFWNTAWTGRQAPHTLGVLCQPKHPALADFPTDPYSNWQWWYLVSRAGALILDDLPRDLRPTVQVIDDWVTNRKLGLVFEARIGRGRLVVCSIDLQHDLDQNLVARQLRASLLRYMGSSRFQPKTSLSTAQVRSLMLPAPGAP